MFCSYAVRLVMYLVQLFGGSSNTQLFCINILLPLLDGPPLDNLFMPLGNLWNVEEFHFFDVP